ncbi:hypothetical protein SRB5_63790 [Streptomyces sp. RB5]|uniref:DUF3558 domain-containing protein n=1 Tax=Streptomyces smaragdinus TaxID=2585196 RepID=A0A7K0CS50_9ACTN|nr:hypothetical protein [Streptomyces smaragdinus]
MAAVCLAALTLTACGADDSYTVPETICGLPVDPALVEPLLPEGGDLKVSAYGDPAADRNVQCVLSVDDEEAVRIVSSRHPERIADPVGASASMFDLRIWKPVPADLGERGAVASNGAIADVPCATDGAKYLTVRMELRWLHVPQKTPDKDYKPAVTEFTRAFTAAAAEKAGCPT